MRVALRGLAEQKKAPRVAGLDSPRIPFKKNSGPKIERHTKAECLLPRCTHGAFQRLGDLRSRCLLFARLFKVRTFSADQPRRLVVFFAIKYNSNCDDGEFVAVKLNE